MGPSASEYKDASAKDGQSNPVEPVVEYLFDVDEELPRALSALAGAPRATAESTLAAHRFGTRSVLAGTGLVDREGDAERGQLRITDLGWRAIELCAEQYPVETVDVEGALKRARAQLYHASSAKTLKLR